MDLRAAKQERALQQAQAAVDVSSHSGHSGKDGGDAWASSMHSHFPRLIFLLVIPFQWKRKGLQLKIATVEQRPALSPQYGTIP